MNSKQHWENIYSTKTPQEVSWTEAYPQMSVDLIVKFNLSKKAKIIDVGGGESKLVDALLDLGYSNITVMDISKAAIDKAKKRLGDKSTEVKWIVEDIRNFKPLESYDIWHDRAAFHFLTEDTDIGNYVSLAHKYAQHIVLGTFSTNGPLKYSGLQITQYDENKLNQAFGKVFKLLDCFKADHLTPFGTVQNFLFSRLVRK